MRKSNERSQGKNEGEASVWATEGSCKYWAEVPMWLIHLLDKEDAQERMQTDAGRSRNFLPIFLHRLLPESSHTSTTGCLLNPAHWGYLWLPLTRAAIRLSVCELIQPIQKALQPPTHHSPALLPHRQHILGALHAQVLSCTPASLLSSLLTALCFCHYINHVLLWNEAYSHRQKAF